MITTEQALDMLPHVVAIIDKLDVQEKATKIGEKYRKKNPDKKPSEYMEKMGGEVVFAVAKDLPKVKEEVFNVIAIAQGCTIDEARQQKLATSVKVIKGIFSDPELMDFFTEAVS